MREIKLRLWNNTIKTFVSVTDTNCIINYSGEISLAIGIKIMQYTGLKDKSGVEVYEGDIVKVTDATDDEFISYDEVVQLPCGTWYLNTVANDSIYDMIEYQDKNVEVVGNIYENKELIKEEAT